MRILNLRLHQFRNFALEEISFSPGTNLFYGRNAQGKTNLLEALHILGFGRSFRTSMPGDCIRDGADQCLIEAAVEHGTLNRALRVLISRNEKKLSVHGKPTGLEHFVGMLHVLAFTNEHLKVVRGAPSDRRGFLDRALVTLYPGHLSRLAAYQRALRQRNSLLSRSGETGKRVDGDLLDSWDEKLLEEGTEILRNRRRYVADMRERLPVGLFGRESLKLNYVSTVTAESDSVENIRTEFRRFLRERRPFDLRAGFTSVGPHRDDLKLYLNAKDLAGFGSAGQQRSSLLSIYFAQMEVHRSRHGFYPVFLMDDLEADLDPERMRSFLEYLSQRTQLFLTTSKESLLPAIAGELRWFSVLSGTVHLIDK